MKVATRLSVGFGIPVLLLGAMLAYQVKTMRSAVSTSYELPQIFNRLEMSRQAADLYLLRVNAEKYWVTQDDGYREQFQVMLASFDTTLQRLTALPLSPQESRELALVRSELTRIHPLAARFEEGVAGGERQQASEAFSALLGQLNRLETATRSLGQASSDVIHARVERSAAASRRAEQLAIAIAVAAVLLSIIVAFWIVRSITRPLWRLQEGTQQVAEGHFAYRLQARGSDEIARVTRDFNRMTERLEELDRAKRDFMTKISHDLKTPVASMQETTRLLLDGVTGEITPRQRRLLALSLESGERLSDMIRKILELSAVESGAGRVEVRRHELGALLAQAVEAMTPALPDGVDIEVEPPRGAVLVDCDRERIRRVLDNLLENAAKFSPADAVVRVSMWAASERPGDVPEGCWPAAPGSGAVALLSVADAGPGVPAEDKERIFEGFYQSAPARKARRGGIGLGLAICNEIIAAHEGRIWVQDNPGGGSIFRIALPGATLEDASSQIAAAEEPVLT